MPPKPQRQTLTTDEKQKLIALVTEIRSRGMEIPEGFLRTKRADWTVDADGYFIKANGNNFIPRPEVDSFVKSEARFAALFAGRGAGKSASGAQKALRKIHQGESGMVMNPDFENFKYSTWPELREWIPWNMVVPANRYRVNAEWQPHEPFTISFMNGAKVICKGLKDPDSARGPNINWLWYDEAGRDPTGLGWKIAVAGVRIGKNPQAWITTTPRGKDHWIYKFFVLRDIPSEVIEAFREAVNTQGRDIPLVEAFFTSIDDNKGNLDPAFYAQMLSLYTGWMKDQELDGKFVDAGGVIGNPEWFIGKIVGGSLLDAKWKVRYHDLAATAKALTGKKADDPDYTCSTLLSMNGEIFEIEDQVAMQIEWHKIKELIVETAKADGVDVPIFIEQEPGAAGKNLVADIMAIPELAGYRVEGNRPGTDKVARAQIWFSKAAIGLVYLKSGEWNRPFLDQLSSFPGGSHDDRIDSVSGCFATIGAKQWKQIEFIKL